MFKRLLLFLSTNLAVVALLSVAMRVLGIEPWLTGNGIDVQSLLLFTAVLGFAGSFVSLAMSKWMVVQSVGARVIDSPGNATERWLLDTVASLANAAGIGTPEVAIYDSPDVNAFATGMNRDNALVAVSTGLLQNLTPEEIEAVLGHEVSHIANGDMVTLTLLQGVINTFVMFLSRVLGFVVDRVVFRTERGVGPGFFVVMIVSELMLGILATMLVMWFSRQREFRADAGGARLAGKEAMIAALERLRRVHSQPLPDEWTAFGIAGEGGGGLRRLFMSHPPIEERIARLRQDI